MAQLAMPIAGTRLETLQTDQNLKFSCARWFAHEDEYPGQGAMDVIGPRMVEHDRKRLEQAQACLAELEEKVPRAELVAYMRWVVDELAGGLERAVTHETETQREGGEGS